MRADCLKMQLRAAVAGSHHRGVRRRHLSSAKDLDLHPRAHHEVWGEGFFERPMSVKSPAAFQPTAFQAFWP